MLRLVITRFNVSFNAPMCKNFLSVGCFENLKTGCDRYICEPSNALRVRQSTCEMAERENQASTDQTLVKELRSSEPQLHCSSLSCCCRPDDKNHKYWSKLTWRLWSIRGWESFLLMLEAVTNGRETPHFTHLLMWVCERRRCSSSKSSSGQHGVESSKLLDTMDETTQTAEAEAGGTG